MVSELDDIPEFVKSVRWIQESGYRVGAMVDNFSNYTELKHDIFQMEKRKNELEHEVSSLEYELAEKRRLRDIEYEALQKMGFGFKEVRHRGDSRRK